MIETEFKTVEDALRHIAEYKDYFLFSTDIYYDDLAIEKGEQFVVKLHGLGNFGDEYRKQLGIPEAVHFRNDNLTDSVIEAIAWLEKTSEGL